MPDTNLKKIKRRREPRFDLLGGPVCLDFINTLDDRFKSEPKELLANYVDLARFAEDTGVLSELQVDRLFALSQQAPRDAARALAAGIQLREAIYAVIVAVMTRKPVPQAALQRLNQYVQVAAQHACLAETKGKFDWRFDDVPLNLEAPLWPIARSVAELLASDAVAFVRACGAQNCQWLFLDASKNHGRRWCDMKRCGNRAKARAFYSRQKKR